MPKHFVVLAVLCGLMASTYGLVMNCGNVFVAPVAKDLGIYQGSFNLSITLLSLTVSFLGLKVNDLIDKFGLKKILWIGVLGLSLATMAMALVQNTWQLLLVAVVRGFFMGHIATVPVLTIVNNWFEKGRGKATSIVNIASGIVGSILTPFFGYLISSASWRLAYVVMGLLIFVFSLPILLYKFEADPQDEGLAAYGDFEEGKDQTSGKDRPLLQKKDLAPYALLILLLVVQQCFMSYFTGYADELGYDLQVSSLMLSLALLGNITSKMLMGALSDSIGIVKTLVLFLVGILLAYIFLIQSQSLPLLYLGSFLYGSVFAIAFTGISLLTLEFFGSKNYPQVYPRVSFISALGNTVLSLVLGYSFDLFGSYRPVLILLIVFVIVSLGLLVFLNKKRQPVQA